MKQTFGKGKRARIPNKRYSDFPLKANKANAENTESLSLENGESKENIEKESGSNSDLGFKDDGSENSSSSSPSVSTLKPTQNSRVTRTGSPSTPLNKKNKLPVDLSNPNYLKPFKFGWKRELVYRATADNSTNKRNGDIYYYTPNGRKVRSMREVSENLKNKELSLDDFTFFKEPIGVNDPEMEIIRDAKLKSANTTPQTRKVSTKLIKTPKIGSPKASSSSPNPDGAKNKNLPRPTGFKVKVSI